MNVLAPVNSLGLGVVALNLCLALEKRGVAPTLWPIGTPECPAEHVATFQAQLDRQKCYSRTAPSLRLYHPFSLAEHVGSGLHAAYTFFELDRLTPAERHHLNAQDRVFVASEWARRIVLDQTGKHAGEVFVARPGVDRTIFRPLPRNAEPGGPTVFFNVGKWEVRKNHGVLALAFRKAFLPTDNVKLVMCCFNPCMGESSRHYSDEWAKHYTHTLGHQVEIVERLPTQAAVAAMMARADCGVFPALAEGWGMSGLETLSMGKHLITTNYSAHTEYVSSENSLLVEIDEAEPAHDGLWYNAEDPAWGGTPGRWAKFAEPQVEQLVAHLRAVHKKKQAGELGVNEAGVATADALSWDGTATAVCQGLGYPTRARVCA